MNSQSRQRYHAPHRLDARGFTLVEMLVVIGIIVLLLGLTLAVSTGLLRSSEVRQAQNTLQIVDSSLQEWVLANDEQIRAVFDSDCDGFIPLDICFPAVASSPDGQDVVDQGQEAAHELLRLLNRNQTSREILTRIDAKFLRAADDGADRDEAENHPLVLHDPWDAQIVAVFAAIIEDPNSPSVIDDDGTPRTVFEDRFGVASNKRAYLVSAGSDGQFGHLHLDEDFDNLNDEERQDVEYAADNVYTYPIIRKRP